MNANKYPFEIKTLEGDLAKKFPELANRMVLVGPKKYCFKKEFPTIAHNYYNLKTRPSDVWIYGYPRSGTTMLQEITWLIGSDLDYEKASQNFLGVRYPFLEKDLEMRSEFLEKGVTLNPEFFDNIINDSSKYDADVIQFVKDIRDPNWDRLEMQKDRRFIKTHIPFSLGPRDIFESGCKIFYMARNPKDCIISNYHLFVKSFREVQADKEFEQYWDEFKHGLVPWTPYFEHLREGWQAAKSNPNVLFLFYNDYKKDMRQTLERIANHLNKKLTEQQLDKLEDHMKIENFRNNKSVNNDHLRKIGRMIDEPDNFIRKGKADGWKDYLTESISADMDRWIQTNLTQMPGLEDFQFPNYEIK